MLVGEVLGRRERTTEMTAASSMACAAPWLRWGRVGWQTSPSKAVQPWTQVLRDVGGRVWREMDVGCYLR